MVIKALVSGKRHLGAIRTLKQVQNELFNECINDALTDAFMNAFLAIKRMHL